ncbi:MAG: tetratricopeptide repeat protein [bacterium]|nr:tetratricopeptide repeat protein [bacterium]
MIRSHYTGLITLLVFLSFITLFFLSPPHSVAESERDSLEVLEEKLSRASGKAKIPILNKLAFIYCFRSTGKALEYGNRAFKLAKEHNEPKEEAAALRNIGIAYDISGHYDKAVDYASRSYDVYLKLGNKKGMASSLNNIGIAFRNKDDQPKALEYYRRAMAIEKKLNNKKGIARSLTNIGMISYDLDRYGEAISCHNQAQAIYRELGDIGSVGDCSGNIGIVYYDLGDYAKALDFLLKALKIRENSTDQLGIASCLTNIGSVYSTLKQYKYAKDYFLRALEIFKKVGDKSGIASALSNVGNLFAKKEEFAKAESYYRQSLALEIEIGSQDGKAISFDNIGITLQGRNKFRDALSYHLKALKINESIKNKLGIANNLNNIGTVYTNTGQFRDAEAAFLRALKIGRSIEGKDIICQSLQHLSELFTKRGLHKQALVYYKELSKEKDGILNHETAEKIARMNALYEKDKKDKQIKLLEQDKLLLKKNDTIRLLELNREKMKSTAFIVGFLLLSVIAVLLFKNYLYLFAFWKKKSFIGPYRIIEEIGSGGMGVIYKASPISDHSSTVAVKVIREELGNDPVQRKRFLHESQIIDQLDHPHIVKVYERGEHNSRLYIAMEILDGRSMEEEIKSRSPIPLPRCIEIMKQLMATVNDIHSEGVIHRDIKPGNITLINRADSDCFVKIFDFGLAKQNNLTQLTEAGEILGTINYLPPEYISSQSYSSLGDIYSLGVVFYELLTQENPYPGASQVDIIKKIMEQVPIEPQSIRWDVPEDLNLLIMNMLNKLPDKRPKGGDVLRILEETTDKASGQSAVGTENKS